MMALAISRTQVHSGADAGQPIPARASCLAPVNFGTARASLTGRWHPGSEQHVVLIADDYDDAREVLGVLLELAGHTVLQAANGVEAVDLATRLEPDLILMDLMMPVMNGLTAAKLLRARSKTAGIRIIAVTANGDDPEWRNEALRSGCDECYLKPLKFESLRDMLGGDDDLHPSRPDVH